MSGALWVVNENCWIKIWKLYRKKLVNIICLIRQIKWRLSKLPAFWKVLVLLNIKSLQNYLLFDDTFLYAVVYQIVLHNSTAQTISVFKRIIWKVFGYFVMHDRYKTGNQDKILVLVQLFWKIVEINTPDKWFEEIKIVLHFIEFTNHWNDR